MSQAPEAHDCSLVSTRGPAMVMTDRRPRKHEQRRSTVRSHGARAGFHADVQSATSCSSRAARFAWQRARRRPVCSSQIWSFVETHDASRSRIDRTIEAMGMTTMGQGARAILEGWTQKGRQADGQSLGGLKAKGNPIGAPPPPPPRRSPCSD